ncbi:hypothetical protein RJ640_014946 [Escallonia rubra]|uniref:LEC14B homolog n=1 Tax=Escallonia rubra TaxID=112253 RepID=A0AA88US75_9ASTE|nr:hypothetical protein RJ640_014946 [Escallonia rubra]
MSRSGKSSNKCDGNAASGSRTNQGSSESSHLYHEIAHLTRLGSEPNERFSRVVPGKLRLRLPISPVDMLVGREANYSGRGRFSSADCCHVLSRYLPINGPSVVNTMGSHAYVSQFSADGSLFIAGSQESHIRIFNVDAGWTVQKDILARSLRWTITDASLSPDQRFLVYSSMSPIVHIVNIGSAETESIANVTEIHEGLDFSLGDDDDNDYTRGIFSVKFSTDGRELVAASGDNSIYVYDLPTNKLSLRIQAHESDVNTVCFADETGHIMYSGSDDRLCKVWDRRCFGTKGQASGVLMGHIEGITFIDSRGDGRYFISNGKDQAIKLWDIRKMSSTITCNSVHINEEWDYRWMKYPAHARNMRHPQDQSLATYKGHSVLRTLIRCYFSPTYSTGQKYIYTGSADSFVYIYDLVTGARVAKLDFHMDAVRDLSWHPFYPALVSSSFDGVIAHWEFPGGNEEPVPAKRRRRWRREHL